jgi:hypothetical protein
MTSFLKDNQLAIHVVSEVLIIGGATYYLYRKIGNNKEKIDELENTVKKLQSTISDQDTKIAELANIIKTQNTNYIRLIENINYLQKAYESLKTSPPQTTNQPIRTVKQTQQSIELPPQQTKTSVLTPPPNNTPQHDNPLFEPYQQPQQIPVPVQKVEQVVNPQFVSQSFSQIPTQFTAQPVIFEMSFTNQRSPPTQSSSLVIEEEDDLDSAIEEELKELKE